jgi:hypothetical protein
MRREQVQPTAIAALGDWTFATRPACLSFALPSQRASLSPFPCLPCLTCDLHAAQRCHSSDETGWWVLPLHLSLSPCLTNSLLLCLPLPIICSGATAAMKLVGESFPWTSPPGWSAEQQVPPGGISDTEVGLATPCGHVLPEVDAAVPTSSHFVYLQ